MKKSKTTDKKEVAVVKENMRRGLVYSLVGPLAGTILWVVLWQLGFIASLAAWLTASWTAKFYEKGAGTITRRSLKVVIPVIVLGVLVSFLASIVSDAYAGYGSLAQEQNFTNQGFFSQDFLNFLLSNLSRAELWLSYKWDILMSLVFAGLGAYGTVRDLFFVTAAPADTTEATPKAKAAKTKKVQPKTA